MKKQPVHAAFLALVSLLLLFCNASAENNHELQAVSSREYLINYWNTHVNTKEAGPIPQFLLPRASPLTLAKSMDFARLADEHTLSAHADSFCESAKLLCSKRYLPQQQKLLDLLNTDVGSFSYMIWRLETGDAPLQPGLFYREKDLKSGNIIPLPDNEDKWPQRPFLPQPIASTLPIISSSKLLELKQIFSPAGWSSSMDVILRRAVSKCDAPPTPNEKQLCLTSAEDMIDFAVSTLGTNSVQLRTMENPNGPLREVMIGEVKRINGGGGSRARGVPANATQVVACHQFLYPSMFYTCHWIPNNHVYQVDLLNPVTKAKITSGIGVCHMDTSQWNPHHMVFDALKSSPGKTEACHWVKEADLIWTANN